MDNLNHGGSRSEICEPFMVKVNPPLGCPEKNKMSNNNLFHPFNPHDMTQGEPQKNVRLLPQS